MFLLDFNIVILARIPNRFIFGIFKTLELDSFDRVRNNTSRMIGISKQLNVEISFIN